MKAIGIAGVTVRQSRGVSRMMRVDVTTVTGKRFSWRAWKVSNDLGREAIAVLQPDNSTVAIYGANAPASVAAAARFLRKSIRAEGKLQSRLLTQKLAKVLRQVREAAAV